MNDLIYRRNAIEGVKELFACADSGNDECDITYMLENLPSADRPTDEVYNYLKERIGDIVDDMKELDAWFERMAWHVKECDRIAKSADRPTGEWVCMGDVGVTECNQCGWSIEEYVGDYKFCPNCGARMVPRKWV